MHKRISLIQIVPVWEEKNRVQGKVSDQSALSLSGFSIFFSCLLTRPHIAIPARGGQHQPTGLASRVLWSNVNQQKQLCLRADIRNRLEGLGMQQKRGKEHFWTCKIYHLQYVRSSATNSAVCHLLSPALPKSDKKYWFKELCFPWLFIFFLALKAFAIWFGKICGIFWKSPIKKRDFWQFFIYSPDKK